MKLIAKIKPSDAEVAANPRARSAVMRVAERLRGCRPGRGMSGKLNMLS